MTNDEIKRALDAGNQTAIAKAFKFDQATALIRKLLKVEGEKVDIKIEVAQYRGNPYLSIETGDLFDCWGTCGRQVWKHIYLDNTNSNFIEKGDDPDKARVWVALHWWYKKHNGGMNGIDFADLLFDFGARPNEWQARMANGTFVTLD